MQTLLVFHTLAVIPACRQVHPVYGTPTAGPTLLVLDPGGLPRGFFTRLAAMRAAAASFTCVFVSTGH